jgi:hypothetical protein
MMLCDERSRTSWLVTFVAALLLCLAAGPGSARAGSPADGSAPVAGDVAHLVTHVPAATLDAVGAGTFTGFYSAARLTGAPLRMSGKPELLTVNTGWCPHCVANSWSLAIALSRFGTLSGLRRIDSGTLYGTKFGANPSYPHTRGLSFLNARLRSGRLAFVARVLQGVSGNTVQRLTGPEQRAVNAFDRRGSVPAVKVGGTFGFVGGGYATETLSGQSWLQIARGAQTPSSPIAQAVDGLANVFTAAICAVTKNRPATVCASAGVTAASARLPQPATEPPGTIVPS